MTTSGSSIALSVIGAAPDTNNLGVRALLASTLNAIDSYQDGISVSVFDNGFGNRVSHVDVGGADRSVQLIGARNSKRLHRSDTLARIAASGALGLSSNPAVRVLRNSAATLDISAGDSFSDIYGWSRFANIALHKQIVLRQNTPLVLMPQTIGPYRSRTSLDLARRVLVRADIAIARDRDSFDHLQEILGSEFDIERHRLGVDLAFGLPPARSTLSDRVEQFFAASRPVIGLNVSGLLYHDPESARKFGLADSYRRTIETIIARLLDETDAALLLVPHVISPTGRPESDTDACRQIEAASHKWGPRICTADAPLSAAQAKGLIARLDWFAGSRMHSTIAALSSCVPSAALAYSGKARGVFASAGASSHVIDLRRSGAQSAAEETLRSFEQRDEERALLEVSIPAVRQQSVAQVHWALDSVLNRRTVTGGRG